MTQRFQFGYSLVTLDQEEEYTEPQTTEQTINVLWEGTSGAVYSTYWWMMQLSTDDHFITFSFYESS